MVRSSASRHSQGDDAGSLVRRCEMATYVPTTPHRGLRAPWVAILIALILVVTVVGVAYAIGRNSGPKPAGAGVSQANLGPQVTRMMPWMQDHVGDIAWMRSHMGDVTWMRSHWNQWQWMQGHAGDMRWMTTHRAQWTWMQNHPAQWQWMQTHMGDIGWMHDHYGQWAGWRSGSGYVAGSDPNGMHGSSGSGSGWDCGPWC